MSRDLVRAADSAQYAREPIPEEQRGQIRVRLLNATPDPLGTVASFIEMYKGHVVRDLSEVTDEMRRAALDEMAATVLNGPLETVQFAFSVEGVTRSITHQMVRSRAAFFAQESLRFAVPEGDWAEEIPTPPWIASLPKEEQAGPMGTWFSAMNAAQNAYQSLIDQGMPAEEARGVLPHDMPTRIMWNLDLRTLLAEAGKRTCTQAQFPWRMIFAGVANALRRHQTITAPNAEVAARMTMWGVQDDSWQFNLIADKIRPVCYQTGECGFMAKFDRSCNIRSRVDAFAAAGVPSSQWSLGYVGVDPSKVYDIEPINDAEWALTPGAARS